MTDLRTRIAAIPHWYHRIELPGGIMTPGWAPFFPEKYGLPVRMDGQRVLDVGAWDGYWSFEALRRGASQVVAIDDFSDSMDKVTGAKSNSAPRTGWQTFDLCCDALGYGPERVSHREMSVYDVSPETLGVFDAVLFFGTLYHLRHPLLALERLAAVCSGSIYVETAIIDDFSPYLGLGKGYPGQMVMEFYPDSQFGNNPTNWWAPSLHCLGHMVRTVGFNNVTMWKLQETPLKANKCRGFATGMKA